MKIAPEQVRAFERQGADLKLILLNGEVVLVQDFFKHDDQGNRSDLVLEDDAGVKWWGQYPSEWSGFHFTEIENDFPGVFPPWLLAGIGLLGIGAAAGASGGGGGGSDDGGGTKPAPVPPPVVTIDPIPLVQDPKSGDKATITGTIQSVPGASNEKVTVTVDGTDYAAVVKPDGTWSVAVPAESLSNGTPVSASGTVTGSGSGSQSGSSKPATGAIPVQFTPEGSAAPATTKEDKPVTGKVTATDKDGDRLTYTVEDAGKPAHGRVAIDAKTGKYTYTPDPDYNGPDEFTVTVRDERGAATTVTVAVSVTPVNDAPVISGVNAGRAVEAGVDGGGNPVGSGSIAGKLAAIDPDAGDKHAWTVDGIPDTAYGTFSVDQNGKWTYALDDTKAATQALNAGETVVLTYTVRVTDGQGAFDTQVVTITITGSNDAARISGTATGAVVEAGDLNNGTLNRPDAQGALRVEDVDEGQAKFQAPASLNGSYGTFTFDAQTGEWSYRLDNSRAATQALVQNEQVTDTLAVTSLDGTATQNIVVTITGSNDIPVVTNGSGSVTEDADPATLTVSGTVGNGQALTIIDADAGQSGFDSASPAFTGNSLSSAALGALAVDADGGWTYTVDNTLSAIQSLGEGETITETWTVKSADGTASSTIVITIHGTNDAPVAMADVNAVTESGVKDGGNVAESGTAQVGGNVLANDSDVDAAAVLKVAGVAAGAAAPVAGNVGAGIAGAYGTLTLGANGAYTYVLDNTLPATQALGSGASDTDVFTYAVTDEFGATRETTLTITVQGTNDAPVIAGGPAAQALTETNAGLTAGGTFTVSDVDVNDAVTASVTQVTVGGDGAAGAPANAVLLAMLDVTPGAVLSGATRSADLDWTFDSAGQAFNYLKAGQTLTLSYTVQVLDGQGASATETVTITITGTNDVAAIGGDITGGVTEDAASPLLTASGVLTIADADAGESKFQAGAAQPVGATLGSLMITESGAWSYQVDNALVQYLGAADSRDEQFTVRGADGTPQVITVTIQGANDGPTIGDVADFGFTEAADASAQNLSASGTVSLGDADTSDELALTSQYNNDIAWSGGTLDAVVAQGLIDGFTASAANQSPGSAPAWSYDVTDANLDFLGAGETITLTYTITVEDSAGATATDEVTITITGTNDAPVISGVNAGAVIEAGVDAGGDPIGLASITGQLAAADADANDTQTWAVDGTPDTRYGTFSVDQNGKWTYALDDTKAATQALNAGETVVLTYTVRVTDSQGAFDTQVVTITITGSNDAARISGTATGAVVEAGDLNNGTLNRPDAQGALRVEDVDEGQAKFQAPASLNGSYGTFTFDAQTGEWSYRLDNSRAATQALVQNEQVTDTLTVTSQDGTATQNIVVTVTGSNDIPVVTNGSGSVTEDADPATLTASGTVGNGQALTITDVDAGQSEFDASTLTFTGTSAPGGVPLGALVVNADGTWDFSVSNDAPQVQALGAGESIVQTWTVKSLDGTASSTITITIHGTNDTPDLVADTATVKESGVADGGNVAHLGTAQTGGNVLANDSDVDGDVLTVTRVQHGAATESVAAGAPTVIDGTYGSLTLNADGSYTYVLNNTLAATQALGSGVSGTDQFTYTVNDGTADATQTLTITVQGTNDAPVITSLGADAVGSVTENDAVETVGGTLTANDVDTGDTLAWSLIGGGNVATGTYGSLDLNATTGEWEYTLNNGNPLTQALKAGEQRSETFTAIVTDGKGATAEQLITVTVNGTNDAPVNTVPDTSTTPLSTAEDTPLSINGVGVSDVDGDVLTTTITVTGGTASVGAGGGATINDNGTSVITVTGTAAQVNAALAALVFVNTPDHHGPASIQLSTTDGTATDTDIIAITVTQVADIANDAVTTREDTPVAINVLANDTFEGPGKAVTHVNDTAISTGGSVAVGNGTVTLNADGTLTFTPAANYNGPASFAYTANTVGGVAETATVSVTVEAVNDAPVAEGTIAAQNNADADGGIELDVTTYFSDVEDAALTYSASGLPDGLTMDPDTGIITGALTKSASQGGVDGVHTVTITATDSGGATATQTFTWTVTNPAPTANDDTVSVAEDTPLTGNVLTGATGGHVADTDPDGDPLSVLRYTVEGKTYSAGATAVITGGTLVVHSNGGYTFTPTPDWNGAVPTVSYTISDGNGGVDTAALNITVTPVNDPATITGPSTGGVTEAGGVGNGAAGSPGTGGRLIVSDVDTGENRYAAPDDLNGTYGSFSFDPLTGVWSYQLDDTRPATQALNAGATVTDTLDVESLDGTATRTITVTITGANDAPYITSTVTAAQGNVTEAGVDAAGDPVGEPTATGTLTADDWDAEDDSASLTWSLSGGGAGNYGNLVLTGGGVWTYTLDEAKADGLTAAQTRTETFTAVVTDARGATAQQLITITISGSNDAPAISGAATGNVAEDGVQTATGQLNKADVDVGDTHAWSIQGTAGAYGTLAVDQTGKWTYTLDNAAAQAIPKGQTVQDTITVRVTDAAGAYADQVVTITIAGENDAPAILGTSTLTGGVAELVDGDPDENGHTHNVAGTIAFSDVDALVQADTHTVQSITPQGAAYLGELTLGTVNDTANTVGWTFQVADSAIDHLAQGEILTQRYDVTISDGQGGTAVTTVTITITGTNDEPVIDTATSDLSATVTEITDGAAGENTHVHGHEGYVRFSDADTLDAVHTATFTPGGADYLGEFTITPVDNVNDRVQWKFTLPDGVLDAWPQGMSVEQTYEITISDGKGGTATETVTITLEGSNDRPLPQDDLSLAPAGEPVIKDVLANDDDVDDGDKARWQVTHVGGLAISEGSPVTIEDGLGNTVGTVSLSGAGELTFTPGPAFTGSLTLSYTVDDGSGASNATATADWIINVADVDIVDNTSPDDPGVGDDVLASIDDLEHVAITGQVPVGGDVTELTVSDGTNSITIPRADITVNPDGSFSTTADVRLLDDGELTVTLKVVDGGGNTASVTDTILKDIVTEVGIDPLLVVNGQVPVITGTGEPDSKITLTIDGGAPVVVTVDGDGKWSHTPPAPLSSDEVAIDADAVDPYGNTAQTSRTIAGLTVEDKEAGDEAHIKVYESALDDGSNAAADTESATSTFTVGTTEGDITRIVIGGSVLDGALSGGTTVMLADLQNIGTTPIDPIDTDYGTLTITAYDAASGVVTYTYKLSGNTTEHSDTSGNDIVSDDILIAVVDNNGDTRVDTLSVAVVDDVPTAQSEAGIVLNEGGVSVGYDTATDTSLGGAANLLDNDTLGADGARVHQVAYTNLEGEPETATVSDGGSRTVTTQYGELTVHSNGDWSYTSNGAVAHGNAASVTDDFSYTLIDGDGDISLPATQAITVNDTQPALATPEDGAVNEDDLPAAGSDDTKESATVTGSLAVSKGADAIDTFFTNGASGSATTVGALLALGLTSGGQALAYAVSPDGHTLTATADGNPVFVVTMTDPAGASGSPGYSFTLQGPLDHPSAAGRNTLELPFGFTSKETEVADGDEVQGAFTITVTDDVPAAANDTATVPGGSYADISGNVITTGAGADATGADGARVTEVISVDTTNTATDVDGTLTIDGAYGRLVIHPDGSYTYTRFAGGTDGGVIDRFTYTLADGDGDTSTATLTVSITNAEATITGLADDTATSDAYVNESKLAAGGGRTDAGTGVGSGGASASGTFVVNSKDGIAELSITHDGTTYKLIEDNGSFTPRSFSTALGNTLSITGYDPETGEVEYTYTLGDDETHASGGERNDLFESFEIHLQDIDGDEDTGTLRVRIIDDMPVITVDEDLEAALVVDESDMAAHASADLSALFGIDHGADGQGEPVSYALSVSGSGVSSGVVDAATGDSVLLYFEGGDVVGRAGAAEVFRISIDGATGEVTLAQSRAIRHGDTDSHDESVSLTDGAVRIRATATDGDGDVVNSPWEDIGNRFTFKDDGPGIEVSADDAFGAPILNTQDADTAGGPDTASMSYAGAFLIDSSSYGADGPGATVWSYALGLQGGAASTASSLLSNGVSVNLYQSGGQIIGSTAASAGAITAANTVFAIAVDAAGTVTLTQYLPLDHPTGGGAAGAHNEIVSLANGLLTLTGTATITDGDGDHAADSVTVNIGEAIRFTDTGPEVGTTEAATVSEAHLPLGSAPNAAGAPVTASGSLDVTASADGIDTRFVADSLPDGLTSGGVALEYDLSADGHTVIAYKGEGRGESDKVFTVEITSPATGSAGYTFTLHDVLDHGGDPSMPLEFEVLVTDGDGDTAGGTFTVTVSDDASPSTAGHTLDEDGQLSFNTSADANPDNTTIWQGGILLEPEEPDNGSGGKDYKTGHGTVTVNADGTITYTPATHYSGTEVFEYRTVDGSSTETTTVTMTVNPVSDEPVVDENGSISTQEDTSVLLGLSAPGIVDDGTSGGNNDTSERLGAITLEGIPAGAKLSYNGFGESGSPHTVDGTITIVLSDGPTVAGATGTLTMTRDQFEALEILPPADDHRNFTVTMRVSSFEVDSDGNILKVDGDGNVVAEGGTDIGGAQASTSVTVYVQAVTDDAALAFDTDKTTDIDNVESVAYTDTDGEPGDTVATVTLAEDSSFRLNDILLAGFGDRDGSEVRSVTITNTTGQAILVNGQELAADASRTFDALGGAAGQTGSISSFPDITIGALNDFSGDLDGIGITINAQDKDADGYASGHAGTVDGVSEADTDNNTVTLNLRVNPVGGDVAASDVTTPEDTAVAFLAGVHVTDGAGAGNEVINSVSFEVPAGWTVAAPAPGEGGVPASGWSVSGTEAGDGPYIVSFNDEPGEGTVLSEAQREAVLDGFTILPPPHSSADATITLSVTSTDSSTVGGAEVVSEPKTVELKVEVTVTPVAEVIAEEGQPGYDTDGDGDPDLEMTPGRLYGKEGAEDTWFGLSNDPAHGELSEFFLSAGWANQDGSETLYARLTPVLMGGDGSQSNPNGSQFRWVEGGEVKTQTYVGSPIDVPVDSLSTLEFLAPADFSGRFTIKVQALAVDVDEDGGAPSVSAVSGEAELTNVLIKPVADEVTLALNGRASGYEDMAIPLSIRPTSSDPSEKFNVTIADIPVGATIVYGSGADRMEFKATEGDTSWTIPGFSSSQPLTIRPPENSNEDFTLKVTAQSVDTLDLGGGEVHTSTKDYPLYLDIEVTVKGLADPADVSLPDLVPTYTEEALDAPGGSVRLSDLVTVERTDVDGSETLTVRISGLAAGFTPSVGILLTPPDVTGADRIWVLTQTQFDAATISTPANFSGTVTFNVAAVTTENDGNSRTGVWGPVSFTVTPSPEAGVTDSALLTEDLLSTIDLGIVHAGGDADETLVAVRIEIADTMGADFTLYLGADEATAVTLAQALSAGLIKQVTADGIEVPAGEEGGVYYLLTAAQAGQLAAKGGAHLDDVLGGFDFQYKINDSHYGSVSTGDTTSEWQDARFTLTALPVTDQPTVSIAGIAGGLGTTVVSDAVAGDGNEADTATLGAADRVTVTLNIASPDYDGSEQVIRVLIDGVPQGVTVTGGELISGERWLLVYEGSNAIRIDAEGGISLPVEFVVSRLTGSLENKPITLTVQVQDRADPDQDTAVLRDSVTWHLNTNFDEVSDESAALIEQWEYNGEHATEDVFFRLSDKITGQVDVQSTSGSNIFTITIEGLPAGTEVGGMVLTYIDNGGELELVWTASVISTPGMSKEAIEALLEDLMDGITIRPPADFNDNNAGGEFTFKALLTTSVLGGEDNHSAEIDLAEAPNAGIPVDPVTDAAAISVALDGSVELDELNESDTSIPFQLTIVNPADDAAGSIIDGKLYLRFSADEPGLETGTLTNADGTITYVLEPVSGVPGLDDGNYYVIEGLQMGDTVSLVYTPDAMTAGNVTVHAWVQNHEAGDENGPLTSSSTGLLQVHISNDGVEIDSAPVTGGEATDATTDSLIQLTGLSVALNDNDGSEELVSILLSNLPDGFLVYIGSSAADAVLASNAGGAGGLNTWVISGADGSLPPYVAILPPQYWSGTLDGLELTVESGEKTLSERQVDGPHPLEPITITPAANGIAITPTTTFGQENAVIPLNLNSSMRDAVDASIKDGSDTVAADESVETTTLRITGLGAHASFYIGDVLIGAEQVSYNPATGSYTLIGLSQSDLDVLGFKQAKSALTDQDTESAGLQIGVEAWTVESGAPGTESAHTTSTITLSVSEQLATTGGDTLLWTGNEIDGRSGSDTVELRLGESLSGADLAAKLSNIETIDLGIAGANDITDLTPEQVQAILGAGGSLSIAGSAEDTLSLDGEWIDNGDGTWTGNIGVVDGVPASTVTLTITGVQVEFTPAPPPEDFGPDAEGMSFGPMAFLLGLESLDTGDGDDGDAFMFGSDGEPPSWEAVLEPVLAEEAEGMDDWLPGESSGGGAPPPADAPVGDALASYAAYIPDAVLPDDELQHGLNNAQVVG